MREGLSTNLTMSDGSTLTYIVNEAIAAYPNDANKHILEFLDNATNGKDTNVSSMEKEAFIEAWNQCILKSKAFGVRSAIDPVAFCKDLILELTYSCEDAVKLSHLLQIFSTEDFDLNLDSKSLHTMSNIGRGLLSALNESYCNEQPLKNSLSFDEAIMAQRLRHRGAKCSWDVNSKKPLMSSTSYQPLSECLLGPLEFIYGRMLLKQKKLATSVDEFRCAPSQLLLSPDALSIVGVKFTERRGMITSQARAWGVHHFLTEAAATSGNICIFPSTLGTERRTASPNAEIVFMYEHHCLKLLVPLFGAHLAQFLRERPTIIMAWCLQLSAAIEILSRPDVSVLQHFMLSDLYVRDDGLLALGNIAVVKREQSSSRSEDQKKSERIISFISSILRSSLCLSRQHTVGLRVDRRYLYKGSTGREAAAVDEEVISIVEGCTLNLNFTASLRTPLQIILRDSGGESLIGQGSGDSVTIDHFDDSGVANLTIDASMRVLKLTALRTGYFMLRASVHEVFDEDVCKEAESCHPRTPLQVQSSRDVRVEVIPATSILSVSLMELIALLEISYTGHEDTFLTAQCFQNGLRGMRNSNQLSEEEARALATAWGERKT